MSTLFRALVLLTSVGIGACGTSEGSDANAENSPGKRLYAFNCGACHGDGALGDGPLAANLPVPPPPLFEHLGHHPMDQLVRIIQTGVPPAMPPSSLEEAEILQVVDYLWTLVPDSMIADLREMQRMMEMDHGAMDHGAAADTTPR